MERTSFVVQVPGGRLGGWLAGDGPPVLLLHGGPGMSFEYIDWLADELGDGFGLVAYQQRGIAPSTTEGPFAVEREVADAIAVLDALGWERAWVVGHSWGGHLLLHLALQAPQRLHGALAVDPLGGVGDGGEADFEAALFERTPEAGRDRAKELDERAMRGEGTEADVVESMEILWPAYFADPARTLPLPDLHTSIPAYSGLWDSLKERLPDLTATLPEIRVPFGFVVGAGSPMPTRAAAATADAVPGAWVDVVEDAGHFPWFERPGSVRAALERLMG
jgi:pimeloyl-ACP methyl ester carboxylesterase